jgi:hypothetical protein
MTAASFRAAIPATLLVLVSALALAVIASAAPVPSAVRDLLGSFAQPGAAVWWFALGGPFQSGPSSPAGITFAAIANAALWLSLAWLLRAVYRLLCRWIRAAARWPRGPVGGLRPRTLVARRHRRSE